MTVSFFEKFATKEQLKTYIKGKNEANNINVEQFLKDNLPKEREFQAKILAAIKGWREKKLIDAATIFWKQNAGIYSSGGLPDIMVLSKGKYFGFEVKRPYIGRLTPLQKKTIENINRAGGYACVVTYASEVKTILAKEGVWLG